MGSLLSAMGLEVWPAISGKWIHLQTNGKKVIVTNHTGKMLKLLAFRLWQGPHGKVQEPHVIFGGMTGNTVTVGQSEYLITKEDANYVVDCEGESWDVVDGAATKKGHAYRFCFLDEETSQCEVMEFRYKSGHKIHGCPCPQLKWTADPDNDMVQLGIRSMLSEHAQGLHSSSNSGRNPLRADHQRQGGARSIGTGSTRSGGGLDGSRLDGGLLDSDHGRPGGQGASDTSSIISGGGLHTNTVRLDGSKSLRSGGGLGGSRGHRGTGTGGSTRSAGSDGGLDGGTGGLAGEGGLRGDLGGGLKLGAGLGGGSNGAGYGSGGLGDKPASEFSSGLGGGYGSKLGEGLGASRQTRRGSAQTPSLAEPPVGVSLLEIQQGVFRLLAGMGYRVQARQFAKDFHTKADDKDMPYLFADLVEACNRLTKAIDGAKLFGADEKLKLNRDLHKKGKALCAEISAPTTDTSCTKGLETDPAPVTCLGDEGYRPDPGFDKQQIDDWMNCSNPLFFKLVGKKLADGVETIAIKNRWWYQQFLPNLLEYCSVGAERDLESEESNKQWPLPLQWTEMQEAERLCFLQARRLTQTYFFGEQQLREKSSDRSAAGDKELSQYVPFLDYYVQKNYVKSHNMRLSFPYYLGPAVWTLHHALAERAAELEGRHTGGRALTTCIVDYLRVFPKIYACPFCRHHATKYVLLNGGNGPHGEEERSLYPAIWKHIGMEHSKNPEAVVTTVQQKLEYCEDGEKLRLFLWKMHCAVTMSIEREEPWYRRGRVPIKGQGFWPSASGETFRQKYRCARDDDRSEQVNEIANLNAQLEAQWKSACRSGKRNDIDSWRNDMAGIECLINQIDRAMVESRVLQDGYTLRVDWQNPALRPVEPDNVEGHIRRTDFVVR
jgi:hypothetical protein